MEVRFLYIALKMLQQYHGRLKVNDYNDYENRVRDCFPHLVFHEEAFKFVDELGKCKIGRAHV